MPVDELFVRRAKDDCQRRLGLLGAQFDEFSDYFHVTKRFGSIAAAQLPIHYMKLGTQQTKSWKQLLTITGPIDTEKQQPASPGDCSDPASSYVTKRFGSIAAAQLPIHYMLSMRNRYSPLAVIFGNMKIV
jgi:hypothetical protein